MNKINIYIIVPIYKTEKYIKRCIDSLVNQTIKNIKIILVDDGSPDNCPKICDDYKSQYSNIFVIHKENSGLSGARNAGLALVEKSIKNQKENTYVGFVDSDDWVANNTYEKLLNLIIDNNAEIAQIEYKEIYNENEALSKNNEKCLIYKNKEILQYYLLTSTKTSNYSVCTCLFNVKTIFGLRFREGKISEDLDYKYKALSNCSIFAYSNFVGYYYWQSTGSITTSGFKIKDLQIYDSAEELYKLAKNETYGTIKKLARVKKARTPFSLLSKIAYYGISDPSINKNKMVKQLINEHRRNLPILLNSPIPLSRKILSISFAINYKLTEILIRIVKYIKLKLYKVTNNNT